MPTFTYKGTAYKQSHHRDAPWIVSFVAPAEELLLWSGIPRRSDQKLIGFQRMDDEVRVARAQKFFTTENNQSPTALIIGIHPVERESDRAIRLEIDSLSNESDSTSRSGTPSLGIHSCRLVVNYDSALPLTEAVERVRRQIKLRLERSSIETEGEPSLDMEASSEESSEDTEVESEETNDDGEIEMGQSLLQELLRRLDNREWCEANADEIRDLAKPATVIDGQHRVKGSPAL